MDLDTVVFGGSIVSGEAGANPKRADIGIAAGVIVGVGDLAHMPATELIDASGLVVTPGFIEAIFITNMHSSTVSRLIDLVHFCGRY